jgi:nicotinamidase-related amidase
MTPVRAALLTFALATGCSAEAVAQTAAPDVSGAATTVTLQMPALPDPVAVTLKPATTALLIFDVVDPICKDQPRCMTTMVPVITAFLERARKAGLVVGYSTRAPTMSSWLPQVAPTADDIKIVSVAQDRFFKTDLENVLKAKGITTLILTGWKVSGSVTYTSVGATLRDFTNVIPVDAGLAATDYETTIGLYNILNQNSSNLKNEPLKPKASTLSRTDLIKFE